MTQSWNPFCRTLAVAMSVVISINLQAGGLLAAVTFFGSVSPDPPGDGDVESALVVGLQGDNNLDFRGFVRIDGGDQIEYDSLIVGDDEGYFGEVIISGSLTPDGQSRLTVEEGGSAATPTVQIGHEGAGRLTIENAGTLFFENNNADLSIGVEPSGVGTMTVSGALSLAVIPDTLNVGEAGIGRLEILNGGTVYASDTTATAAIGATATGVGTVRVDGVGSVWRIADDLAIGSGGSGTLIVSDQGLIDVDRAGAVTTIGGNGRLELADGLFSGAVITLNGYLGGSGLVRGTLSGAADSLIDVPAGGLLRFADSVANQGSVRIREGEAVFLAGFDNLAAGSGPAAGRITLESGRVRFSQSLTNNGVIAVAGGANHLHGPITNGASGAIVLASASIGTFYAAVDVGPGSLELLAGANGLFLADLTFATGSLVNLQLADTASAAAQIHVSGRASLAGGLEVGIAGSAPPVLGDSFQLLFAADGIHGEFDTASFPRLDPGLLWDLNYGTNNVVLAVVAAAPADFNLDGKVDGDDLAQWEGDFGGPGSDADDDGDSDGADFLAWQRQFGSKAGQIVSLQTVPEPASAVLLAGLAAIGTLVRCGAGPDFS